MKTLSVQQPWASCICTGVKDIEYIMLSDWFTSVCNGATFGAKMPRVPSDFISSLRAFIPPINEQLKIIEFIESQNNKIISKISKAQNEINLLKEYRSSLITEVVTGKRKVV